MAEVEYILDRDILDESIKEIAKRKVVLDIGAGSPLCKELSKYKSIFKNTQYYSLDIKFHPQLDLIADVQALPFKDACIDGIICKDVLYLVAEPKNAVNELLKILNKGGLVFISAPFLYPYHGKNGQRDFWRFSKDGLEYMFSNFSKIKLQPCGSYINTALSFMIGFKPKNRFLIKILEKPLCLLINFLRRKTINSLHNPMSFNILLRK